VSHVCCLQKLESNDRCLRFVHYSNRITRDGAAYLPSMLDKSGLLRLSLALNRLENEGAGHIATALLQSNSRLRRSSE
jgi:hypothetical protein